ncbi:MAG: glycosyltransferase [Actinomycetota bacterium]
MKIAHVFKDAYPPLIAGITRYVHDVAAASVAQGHEVEIIVAGVKRTRRDVMADGTVILRCGEWARALSMPLSPRLVSEVRAASADVLHVHMPNPIGELGVVLRRPGTAVVASLHAQLGRQQVLEGAYRPLRSALLRRASTVLVASEPMMKVPELAGFAEKTKILPYGVSPGLIARRNPSRDDSALRALFVGRLVYYKGLDILFDALEQLPDVRLTVVGEGPSRDDVERRARVLGGRVTLAGRLSDADLGQAYATHDVLVLPSVSRAEAFGLAATEAMANGLPVVSTALGTGTDWVNRDGVTGYVVAPGDAHALADALRRLESEPETRRRLGEAGMARAAETFSFVRHVKALHQVYGEAVGRG